MGKSLVILGSLGSALGLLCCFTALLPAALTAIGATGLINTLYRDIVLLPFVGVSLVALALGVRMSRRAR